MISGVAQRYALALFSLAQERALIEDVAFVVRRLQAIIVESPDLRWLLASKILSEKEQGRALDALMAAAEIGGLTANFVRLIVANGRLPVLLECLRAFQDLDDHARGLVRAQVTSAVPLGADQVERLKMQLQGQASGSHVEMDVCVDPEIIGGLIVILGNRRYDGSLKTKLKALHGAMKEVR